MEIVFILMLLGMAILLIAVVSLLWSLTKRS